MKPQFLVPIVAILPVLLTSPAYANNHQTQQTTVLGRKDFSRPQFTMLVGRVNRVDGNRIVLDRAQGQMILNAANRIDLVPNEPITVTGNIHPNSNELNVFSITRSNGSVIEFRNGKMRVSSLADQLS